LRQRIPAPATARLRHVRFRLAVGLAVLFVGLQDGFREHLLLRLDSLSEEMCVATLQLFDTIISQFHQALAPCKRRTVLQHVC
jgi:hypothetical protein